MSPRIAPGTTGERRVAVRPVTARWSALVAAIVAVVIVAIVAVGPAAAQEADGGATVAGRDLAGEIQVLSAAQSGEEVVLELAIPPSIGELAPVGANFGVTDGGQLVDVSVAPLGTRVDAVVVLDTSGSMAGDALSAARSAAASFVDRLPGEARVGLISFGEAVTVHQGLDGSRSAVLDDLGQLSASGETALWDALVTAAGMVEVGGADRPYVIVLSDGEDTVSEADRAEVVDRLGAAGAGLYAVAIDSPDTDMAALESVVGEVGGQFFATADVDELDVLYADIAQRLTSRYQLRYRSDRVDVRNVVISVAVDGAIATARTSMDGTGSASAATPAASTEATVESDDRLGPVAALEPGLLGGGNARLVGLGLLAGALTLVAFLVVLPSSQARLDPVVGADRVAGINHGAARVAERLIARRDDGRELDKALDAAGINLRPGEFTLLALIGIVAIGLGASLLGGFVLGFVAAMAGTVGLLAMISVRASRRRGRFADQLTDTLGIMISGLRAGRGLPQTIELVAEEAPSPTSEQFQRIVFETRVGRDLSESMLSVADRMKSQDLDWVTRAVDINRELGGNLTETLENVAATIRDRRRVARQVRALSAEGRASGWVLLALPVLMFLFLWWRTPDNVHLMVTEPLGRTMLGVAGIGMVIGWFWIRKLVQPRY